MARGGGYWAGLRTTPILKIMLQYCISWGHFNQIFAVPSNDSDVRHFIPPLKKECIGALITEQPCHH